MMKQDIYPKMMSSSASLSLSLFLHEIVKQQIFYNFFASMCLRYVFDRAESLSSSCVRINNDVLHSFTSHTTLFVFIHSDRQTC